MYFFQLRVLDPEGSLFDVVLTREHAHYFFSKSKFRLQITDNNSVKNVQLTPDESVAAQPNYGFS